MGKLQFFQTHAALAALIFVCMGADLKKQAVRATGLVLLYETSKMRFTNNRLTGL